MIHALQIHNPGAAEAMQWETVDVGHPGPGQIRLRHTAVGLNYIDVYHRSGLYPVPLPFIPGVEAAGIVEAVGEGVLELKVGDRVAYAMVLGGYSEARLIAADRVVKLPDEIDDVTAAAIMLQGMTAQYLIREIYRVQPGDTILVHAAAGGVGLILCQWAAALGATVIGTVSTSEKAALAAANGCHYPIIYTQDDFSSRVIEITNGQKLPVVYDSVGKDTFAKSLDCLRPRGIMITFGQASGPIGPVDLGILAQKGSLMITRPSLGTFVGTEKLLKHTASEVFDAVTSAKFTVRINQTYALRDAVQSHRDLENRKTTGSTVLTV